MVVGAPEKGRHHCGTAYEFTRPARVWKVRAELVNSGCIASDLFGFAAATAGRTALIGAEGRDKFAGAAYELALR
jgi:hypothetical protein